ncbi:hypothetical protein JHK84_044843 [Glycine max]|nr:hypothetical protein JHK86_044736 [Glycine max]KAG4951481.1 hypothetical protein JHK85_045348 [Glycine max]KAG5107936.1 hypothetical protein JHK84_044843 [Glycine max]
MHAYVKKSLVYKFQNQIKEGSVYSFNYMHIAENIGEYITSRHVYKLTFQFGSKILLVSNDKVSTNSYSHVVPIFDIVKDGFDTDYLVENDSQSNSIVKFDKLKELEELTP